jgi:hypothetical protein
MKIVVFTDIASLAVMRERLMKKNKKMLFFENEVLPIHTRR